MFEFVLLIQRVLKNYAGVVGSDSSKAVFLTLKENFRQCRVFHDYNTKAPEEKLTSEFINLVRDLYYSSISPVLNQA